MFYSIKGKLIHAEQGFVVVECGGVGFKCFTTLTTQRTLAPRGSDVTLFTHLSVREDALDLFGFATMSELNCFKLVTSVSGVGPKAGIAILSELTSEQLAIAVAAGDTKAITRAQGVGPKIAQRIIVELKDKMSLDFSPDGNNSVGISQGVASAAGNASQAINALTALGYMPSDAAKVVSKFDPSLSVEELIRLSLKSLGSKFN